MAVLIGCECSQVETIAMRNLGIEAYSCDIKPCYGGHPEWHIRVDLRLILRPDAYFWTDDGEYHSVHWDLLIAHPPCTYLSRVGPLFKYDPDSIEFRERFDLGLQARSFFMDCLYSPIEHVVVENPTPFRIFKLPKWSQTVQSWHYGDATSKCSRLWLRNVRPLFPECFTVPIDSWTHSHSSQRKRSQGFTGLASAYARQWGLYYGKS